MKKYLFLFLLFSCFSFTINIHAQNLSWYKWLTGSIDKYSISMHLHKMGHKYAGYYYYNKTQQPIYFTGTDTTIKNAIELSAFGDYNDNGAEQFIITINNNQASGTWQKDEHSKKLNFSAVQKKGDETVDFTVVYTTGETKLRPKLAESPVASYAASSVWPTGNSDKDEFIKTSIRKIFGVKEEKDIGAYFLIDKKLSFDQYKEDFKDDADKDIAENPFPYNYETIQDLMIMYQSQKFITLGDYTYSYSGGAHGNYGTGYYVLDLLNLKQLTLPDVLTDAGIKALPKILEAQFRMDNNLMQTDSLQDAGLFENKIEPNDNFFITPNGIGFNYSPYEIGPYAMGEVDIFIPFIDLTEYLQSTIRELIKK